MNDEVKNIELNIEEAREFVKFNEALERLGKNKDFQTVILKGYFKEEPARLVEALAAPNLQDQKFQDAILKSMEGIGQLQQFFNKVQHQADMAQSAIEEGQRELDDMAERGDM